jgi:hypothetical protein
VPAFPEREDRTSFSSTKESDTGVAQSFTNSKTSSYLRWEVLTAGSEEAIDDTFSTPSGGNTPVEMLPEEVTMLNPQSTLHGLVCPCDSFRGWKNISIGGKVASKSFGDLRRLALRWDWDTHDEQTKMVTSPLLLTPDLKKRDGTFLPGQSPFERLPMELLGEFLSVLLRQCSGLESSDPFGLRLFSYSRGLTSKFGHVIRTPHHRTSGSVIILCRQFMKPFSNVSRLDNRPACNRHSSKWLHGQEY